MLAIGGNATTTAKPTVTVVDTTNGASMTLRGQSPKLSFDITSGGVGKILMDGAGIEFKDGTLDSEGNVDLKIDSSGNVGIGNTSPSSYNAGSKTLVIGDGGTEGISIHAGTGMLHFTNGADTTERVSIKSTVASNTLEFTTGGSERMRIDSSGNVGIGTDSPNSYTANGNNLVVADVNVGITLASTSTVGSGALYFADGTSGSQAYRGIINYLHASDAMGFHTGASERMRIDSSGNLLVGKTVADTTTLGNTVYAGIVSATMSGDPAIFANRAQDGSIIELQKSGAPVGVIGVNNTDNLFISGNSTHAGLEFLGVSIAPHKNGSLVDNTLDIGTGSHRFDDIYATNGTIQTSDRNEKQDIAELSDAEQRVAVAAKGLLRKFRWRDAVAEKGDEARTHFGIIAQDLQAAFAAEGLDAGDYAMFISSTWTDEDTGEERTRMGVRYSELLAFIIAAI
jgi:hypothetical protein